MQSAKQWINMTYGAARVTRAIEEQDIEFFEIIAQDYGRYLSDKVAKETLLLASYNVWMKSDNTKLRDLVINTKISIV